MFTLNAWFLLSLYKSVCCMKCKRGGCKTVLGLMLGVPGTGGSLRFCANHGTLCWHVFHFC